MSKNILVLDDDEVFLKNIESVLKSAGFSVDCEHDSHKAVKETINKNYTALITEILLPEKNGFEVIREIRDSVDIPIIVVSSREDEIDKLLAFHLGADDYIQKPTNQSELIARLNAILSRAVKNIATKAPIKIDNLKLFPATRKITVAEKEIILTNTEYRIIEILMLSPEQAFSKEELTEFAMGKKFSAYDRSIDVHVSNLRQKIGPNSKNEDWIKTIRGFGYCLNT